MNAGKKEYTFLWFIENYSYCWHKNGEKLISPEFFTDDLEGTAWKLWLYPRGQTDEYKGYVSMYLLRSSDGAGPFSISVEYELSVLAADGSTLFSKQTKDTFNVARGFGYPNALNMEEVVSSRKTEYLPQDTLSVRCKIWMGEGEVQPQVQIYARTRIGIEQVSFFHITENFSTLQPNQKKTRDIKIRHTLTCSLYLSDCSCCDEKIMLQITPSNKNHIVSRCKISLIDKSQVKIECGKIENQLDPTGKNIQTLPLSITKQDLLSKKSEYLPNDRLTLSCECSFLTGVEYKKIERIVDNYSVISKTVMMNTVDSVNPAKAILKCLFAAIFSGLFGILVAYLCGD